MRGTVMRAWPFLLVLALAPTATAEPATLYFHVFGAHLDAPINTQVPPADWQKADMRYGVATNTLTCVGETPAQGVTAIAYHTTYGHASPNFIDYGVEEDGMPRMHPERGLGSDAVLDPSQAPTLYWYLSSSVADSPEALPVPVPEVTVRVTVREGDALSVDDAAYNSGAVLMQGQSPEVTLAGSTVVPADVGVRSVGTIDGVHAYEFAIPLGMQAERISRTTGFNVRVDTFVDAPVCDGRGELMPNVVGLHTSVLGRPRLELAVRDQIRFEYLQPEWTGDDLVLHANIKSVWGPYDIVQPVALEVKGPGQAAFVPVPQPAHLHVHGHPYAADGQDVGFVWEGAADAPAGEYELRMVVQNLQGTAFAEQTVGFEVAQAQEAPAPGALLAGAAFLLAGLALRSRRVA